MEYPRSLFTRPWRRLVLILFILSFFILTPLILLYSIGYRFDPEHGILRKTGALSIDALPHTATVYVNGQNVRKKIPVRFSAVNKGIYPVRITQSGYYDWQKEIEVRDHETTYIKDIHLIKKAEPELVREGVITTLSVSPNNEILLYISSTKTATTLSLVNTSDNKLLRSLPLPPASSWSVLWSLDQSLVALQGDGPVHPTLIVPVTISTPVINLSELNVEPISKIAWRGTATPELYYETRAHKLYSFNPHTKNSTFLMTLDMIQDWVVNADEVWTLRRNTSTSHLEIVRDTLITPEIATVLDQPEITLVNPASWRLRAARGETVALQHLEGSLTVLAFRDQLFSVPASDLHISPFQNWWLFSSPYELWSYREGEAPHLVTRSGDGLGTVVPLDPFNTLLLVWQNKNTILFPYYYVTHDFLTTRFTAVTADTDHRVLYFAGIREKREGLWRVGY